MQSLLTYLKNVQGELKHVVWPSPRTAGFYTLLIILISAFTAVFLGVLDHLLTSFVGTLI